LKELQHVHGAAHIPCSKSCEDSDVDCEIAEPGRHSIEREKTGEQKWMEQKRKSETSLSAIVSTTTLPGYPACIQGQQEEKLVSSNLSIHRPNGNSSRNIGSTDLNVSEKEDLQDSSFVPASRQSALPLSLSSFHPDERIRFPIHRASKPDPFLIPEHEVDNKKVSCMAVFDSTTIQDIKIQYPEHAPAAVVYFNTRFIQTAFDASKWVVLGTNARLSCVKFHRSFAEFNSEEEEEIEGSLSVGAPLLWRGCRFLDDEESLSSFRKQQERTTISEKSPGEVSFCRTASSPPSAFVPKLDLAQVYKSQKLTSSWKRQHRRNEDVKPRVEDLIGSSNAMGTKSSSSKETQVQSTSIVPQQDAPYCISEKARGKQKAIDPDFLDATYTDVPPTMVPSITTTTYFPNTLTDPIACSYQPSDPHDVFNRDMEDYVAFSLSTEKPSDHEGENNITSSSRFPLTVVSAFHSPITTPQYSKNPFRLQSNMEDLFLAPQALGSSVSNGLNSIGEGYYLQLDDSCEAACSEGEDKLDQLTTINPAFLGGDTVIYDDDSQDMSVDLALSGISGTEITPGTEGTGISGDTRPSLAKGYQSTIGLPISTFSSSSTSQSTASTRPSQTQTYAVQSSQVPTRDLSPEECEATNARSQSIGLSCSLSLLTPRERAIGRAKTLISDEERDKEKREVLRGSVNCNSSSEENVGLSPSKYVPFRKPPHPVLAAQPREPIEVASKRPESMLSRTRQTAPRRHGQQWQVGEKETYCHQCRRKTRYLKMSCPCSKKYCNRCVALR